MSMRTAAIHSLADLSQTLAQPDPCNLQLRLLWAERHRLRHDCRGIRVSHVGATPKGKDYRLAQRPPGRGVT
jgi:hypothetical protein